MIQFISVKAGSTKHFFDVTFDLLVSCAADRLAGDEDDVPTIQQALATQSDDLFHAAAYEVSYDRLANPPAHGETETAPGQVVRQDADHDQPAGPAASLMANLLKAVAFPQSVYLFHRRGFPAFANSPRLSTGILRIAGVWRRHR